jgi:hypothetical protein
VDDAGKPYLTVLKLVDNASNWLEENKFLELYSGASKAIVAALLGNKSIRKISKILKVNSLLLVSGAPLAKTFTYFRFTARSSEQRVDFATNSKEIREPQRASTR